VADQPGQREQPAPQLGVVRGRPRGARVATGRPVEPGAEHAEPVGAVEDRHPQHAGVVVGAGQGLPELVGASGQRARDVDLPFSVGAHRGEDVLGDVGDQDVGAERHLGHRLVDVAGELVGDGEVGGVDDVGEHPRPRGLGAVVPTGGRSRE
jgi:hypothetical protein